MTELTIIDELKNLLPPLSNHERAGLEKSICRDGVISPLIVSNNVLIDGHYRYEICKRLDIPFSTKEIHIETLEDAKLWIWQHQEGRRNLTPFQKAELALRFKHIVAAKAKERQVRRTTRSGAINGKIPDEAIETRKVLCKMAGISHGTLQKVEFIMQHADEATKERLRNGEKGISIHSEYNRLRYGELRTSKVIENTVQKSIHDMNFAPDELGKWIIEHYPVETQREVARILVDHVLKHVTS